MSALEAVVPLVSKDLDRFSMLARSLETNFVGLGRLYVVVPNRHLDGLSASVRAAAGGLRVEVVPESRFIPEMASFRHLPGWYKHQLVKLAAAEIVSSDYYL